jgi:hypothetical protein
LLNWLVSHSIRVDAISFSRLNNVVLLSLFLNMTGSINESIHREKKQSFVESSIYLSGNGGFSALRYFKIVFLSKMKVDFSCVFFPSFQSVTTMTIIKVTIKMHCFFYVEKE